MSLVSSIIGGTPGIYSIFGNTVEFASKLPAGMEPIGRKPLGFLGSILDKCTNNRVFHVITGRYLLGFIHEMGHVLAKKVLSGENSKITITVDGYSSYSRCNKKLSDWKMSVIDAAGPITSMAFSTGQLIVAEAAKGYISWPIAAVLSAQSTTAMIGEMLDACVSTVNQKGDFGRIMIRNSTHHALSITALVSLCALEVFARYTIAS